MADIKQIKATNGTVYDIDAKKWNGHTFDEITNLIHGVVDTYVIPAQTSNKTADYTAIVESTESQVSTTASKLGGLTGTPAKDWDKFGVGDIVLMGATSDGKTNFDRWISYVGAETDPVIKLDVLETQVAKHHHTISASGTSKALTGVSNTSNTATIPVVGTAVTVLTSAKGTFVTSVAYDGDGSNTMAVSHESGTGSVSHKHTVDSHTHSITPSTLVSRNLSVYYSLTSANHTPHTHTNATVAGAHVNDSTPLTYVTGSSTTDTFVKTLKQTSTNTGAASGNTAGSGELTTSAQVSTDTIGEVVKTASAGTHSHTVTAATTTSVVTAATVATSVVTSVKLTYTAPTVQTSVATSWVASVDSNGVLSFTVPMGSQSKGSASIEAPRASQSEGSASIEAPRASQSRTYGAPTISVTCGDAGSHQHGFSHTHKIATHSHGLNSHTHTYDKATVSASAAAITALATATYTPHTHTNVTVVGTTSDAAPFKYVTGGSATNVVRDLKDSAVTTTSAAPGTNTVYTKLTGDITFPGLSVPTGSISTSSKSITPAAAGSETAIKSITFTSSNFVTGVTAKTSPNIGGE